MFVNRQANGGLLRAETVSRDFSVAKSSSVLEGNRSGENRRAPRRSIRSDPVEDTGAKKGAGAVGLLTLVIAVLATSPVLAQTTAAATPGMVHDDEAEARPVAWTAQQPDSVANSRSAAREWGARENSPAEQIPFAFAVDPSLAHRGAWSLSYHVNGDSGVDALRPLGANRDRHGLVQGVRLAWSAADWAAPFVTVQDSHTLGASTSSSLATLVGLKLRFTPRSSPLQLGVESAAMREFAGDVGLYSRLLVSYDVGRVRLVGNAHVEKIFDPNRDAVDLLMFGGTSVRVVDSFRLGAEYIGQDLEDAFEQEEAEGGAKHYVAPVASVVLRNGSLWITGGPAFGLTAQTPAVMGRLQVMATF